MNKRSNKMCNKIKAEIQFSLSFIFQWIETRFTHTHSIVTAERWGCGMRQNESHTLINTVCVSVHWHMWGYSYTGLPLKKHTHNRSSRDSPRDENNNNQTSSSVFISGLQDYFKPINSNQTCGNQLCFRHIWFKYLNGVK